MLDDQDAGQTDVTTTPPGNPDTLFKKLRAAVFANPYHAPWGDKNAPPLPHYDGASWRFWQPLSWKALFPLWGASKRILDNSEDLRWDRTDPKLVHANGVCLTGLWEINVDNKYGGLFSNGSRAPIVVRISTATAAVKRGEWRSLGLVGKLVGRDADGVERTANFIMQDDIGGAKSGDLNDVEFRTAPDVSAPKDFKIVPTLITVGSIFSLLDFPPRMRELHQVAELGAVKGETPKYMRLRMAADHPRIEGDGLDIRDEVMELIYDKGDPTPKRKIVYDIEVADEGKFCFSFSKPVLRGQFSAWRRIGRITLDEATISYNGDHALCFHHGRLRK